MIVFKVIFTCTLSYALMSFCPSYAQGYKVLTVRDFQGKPDQHSPYLSTIKLRIGYESNVKKKGTNYDASFQVYLGVDSARSWIKFSEIKDKNKLQSVLNHEQGHLKIGALMQRELVVRLQNKKYTARYKQESASIFDKVARKYQAMQDQYDRETQHMINREAQSKWDSKLDSLLGQ